MDDYQKSLDSLAVILNFLSQNDNDSEIDRAKIRARPEKSSYHNGESFSISTGMRYKVKLKESEEGYAIWCPSLPGCWSQGETKEEALENIKDAIQAYLETVEELNG